MGLDISHDAWSGAYSSFNRWRTKIAEVSGFPELHSMQGFGGETEWDPFMGDPLYELLSHSDCDGQINYEDAGKIADTLQLLLPKLQGLDGGGHIGDYGYKTSQFIKGCRLAYILKENLDFH